MKKNNFYKTAGRTLLAIGVITTALLSSCLKDTSPGALDLSKSPALVGFQYLGFGATPLTTKLHGIPTDTSSVKVTLSVPSVTLSSAVTVNLAVDDADANAYVNANSGTHVLPAADYTIANNGQVTINPGQQYVRLKINFKGNQIDFSQNYILALKISSANGAIIASNLNVAILTLTLQSNYEGRYVMTGSFVDNVNPGFTDAGVYPDNIQLLTVGPLVVDFYETGFGFGYAHPINAGGITAYGAFAPEFTFDSSGKVIAVTNAYGQHAGGHGRSGRLDVSGVNASSGTPGTPGFKIQVKYVLVQDDAGGDRTFFNETYTYTGPI